MVGDVLMRFLFLMAIVIIHKGTSDEAKSKRMMMKVAVAIYSVVAQE